jgi:chitin disaccharide deacetylase
MTKRLLIVNADDFGQSAGINRGVVEAHERGIVSSASVMVRWPAAAEAAAYGRRQPALSLGLHLDFAEWAYRDGSWTPLYEVVSVKDRAAVAAEVSRQLDMFRQIVGRDPTHIDSHQHSHREEPVRSIAMETARSLAVPLRQMTKEIVYRGDFYGQSANGEPSPETLTADRLIAIISSLAPGITELGCHPGDGEDSDSMYRTERAEEVRILCDPRVRAALGANGVELCSFSDVAGLWTCVQRR